jgi:hypothetical protein
MGNCNHEETKGTMNVKMTKIPTLCVLLVFSFLAGCQGRSLSRQTAASAITAEVSFPFAEYRELAPSQFYKQDSDGSFFINNWPFGTSPIPADIAHFIQTGLLTTVFVDHNGNVMSTVRLASTSTTEGLRKPDDQGKFEIKICDHVFGDITGIQTDEQAGTSIVEYTVKRTNWTPFGEYYRQQNPQLYPDIVALKAIFKRYDDGWRLTQLGSRNIVKSQ